MIREINKQEVAGKICSFQLREKNGVKVILFTVAVHHGKPNENGKQAVWFVDCCVTGSAAEYMVKSHIEKGFRIYVSGVHGVPTKKVVAENGKEITKSRNFLYVNEILAYEPPAQTTTQPTQSTPPTTQSTQEESDWLDEVPF